MIIHHISLGTNDIERARGFYDAVFGVLGLRLLESSDRVIDYGAGAILISINQPLDGKPATPGNGSHVAFSAENRAMVDEFYRLALSHGGSSDGEPGVRPEYDPHYYGAFVLDPDGNKIEAVTYSAK
jgi:catechol 2,3-dioxygenase-like lactoylglutathione lyase family enzyme